MFEVFRAGIKVNGFDVCGEAIAFVKNQAATELDDVEYKVQKTGFPFAEYKRSAFDLQLEGDRNARC